MSDAGKSHSYYLVSGGLAGMVEHFMMFPVDTIKTHMQADSKSLAFRNCLQRVTSKGGPLAFYHGVLPGVCGAFPSHAAYFTVYEKVKHGLIGSEDAALWKYTIAGACASVGHDFCHTPFDVLKQRMQMSGQSLGRTVGGMLSKEGPRALFVSFPTTLLMNVPFSAAHFTTYEAIKLALNTSAEDLENDFWKFAVAGGSGGVMGAIISNPLDVIKTRQQLGRLTVANFFKAFGEEYRKEGPKVFSRGMKARILYFAPSGAIQMTSYEIVKRLLSPLMN
eukprot:NODE_1605_length_1115_cov_46.803940_g1309_i0.p1 GENE.NODE_1605_length_1115_cov_46.803940_g1309_i0~~NODE_1605_length_1115_cov_46.803940_g1309_i0.p1  ORF type:complete len:299 (+),score=69.96 NODE_1605_length_1115_cov_46.803940_g1309_i0:64-897(+)